MSAIEDAQVGHRGTGTDSLLDLTCSPTTLRRDARRMLVLAENGVVRFDRPGVRQADHGDMAGSRCGKAAPPAWCRGRGAGRLCRWC